MEFLQNNAVMIVFFVIILSFLSLYIHHAVALGRTLKRQQSQLDQAMAEEPTCELQFTDPYMLRVHRAYTANLAGGGAQKLNTTALMDSCKPIKLYRARSVMVFCSAVVITLGLLGTFVGFFISLSGFDEAFQNIAPDPSAVVTSADQVASAQEMINQFSNDLKQPLEGINIGFLTSIVGLILAIFMNLHMAVFLRPAEERFDESFVSYLDNVVSPLFTKDSSHTLNNALLRIEENLTGNIQRFSTNVAELNASMNGSVNVLNSAVGTLEKSITGLNGAIGSFTKPLDDFAERILALGSLTQTMDVQIKRIEDLSGVLADNVVIALTQSLDQSVENINDATRHMSDAVQTSTTLLGASVQSSIAQLELVMEGLKNDLHSSVMANMELQSAVKNMAQSNEGIQMTIQPFIVACSSLTENARMTTELVRSFIDAGVERIRKESDIAIDAAGNRIVGQMRQGLDPTFTMLREVSEKLHTVVSEYNGSLSAIVGELRQAYDSTNQTLNRSYQGYMQTLLQYDAQVHHLSEAINTMNAYVMALPSSAQGN